MYQLVLDFATYVLTTIPVAIGTSFFYVRKRQRAVAYLLIGFGLSFLISPLVASWAYDFAFNNPNGEYILASVGLLFYVFFVVPFLKKKRR